ncbi:trehalose-6-phosphate hydrolase, partial [Pseudomonas aeruginosa]|nr:trehalose-6-phosphate hydrolase [Pseudomonas aeruginosa]
PGAAAADSHHQSFSHVRLSARGPRRARGWR